MADLSLSVITLLNIGCKCDKMSCKERYWLNIMINFIFLLSNSYLNVNIKYRFISYRILMSIFIIGSLKYQSFLQLYPDNFSIS